MIRRKMRDGSPVHPGRLLQLDGDGADEARHEEDRRGEVHPGVDGDHSGPGARESQLPQFHDDGDDGGRQQQSADAERVRRRDQLRLPAGEDPCGARSQDQYEQYRRQHDEKGVDEAAQHLALAEGVFVVAARLPLLRQVQVRSDDLGLWFGGGDDDQPQRYADGEPGEQQDERRTAVPPGRVDGGGAHRSGRRTAHSSCSLRRSPTTRGIATATTTRKRTRLIAEAWA